MSYENEEDKDFVKQKFELEKKLLTELKHPSLLKLVDSREIVPSEYGIEAECVIFCTVMER